MTCLYHIVIDNDFITIFLFLSYSYCNFVIVSVSVPSTSFSAASARVCSACKCTGPSGKCGKQYSKYGFISMLQELIWIFVCIEFFHTYGFKSWPNMVVELLDTMSWEYKGSKVENILAPQSQVMAGVLQRATPAERLVNFA